MNSTLESSYAFIPVEIWEGILKTYSIYDLILVRSVSKYLYDVCKCFIRKIDEETFDQEECLQYYAEQGFGSCLVWARQTGYSWMSSLCTTAAKHNHFDTLKILRSNGCDWESDVCDYAAANGNLEMLTWAHENGCPWTSDTCLAAARTGQLECLKYAMNNKCKWKTTGSVSLQLDLIEYLSQNECSIKVEEVYLKAAKEGKWDLIKYLHKRGNILPTELLASAVEFGSIEFVEEIRALPNLPQQTTHFLIDRAKGNLNMTKYVIDQFGVPAQSEVAVAARSGSLDVLMYFHEELHIPISPYTLKEAVSSGNFEMVKYLVENCNVAPSADDSLCMAAAGLGHVEMLKYFHEHGSPLKHGPMGSLYSAAISAKSVACMKYAFENGCPVPVDSHMVCRAAVEQNTLECLKYAREIGCKWNSSDSMIGLCHIAMTVGNFEIFKYLHQNGCSLHQDICIHAAKSGRLAFMKYAKKFVRWDQQVIEAAASSFQATCLKYAHNHGLKLTPNVISEAVTCQSLECLKYAVQNGCEWPSDIWTLAEEADMNMYMYITAHCPVPQKTKKKTKPTKKTRPPVS